MPVDGVVLRRQRHQLGITREELGDISGLTSRTIQNAENGGPVSAGSVNALSRALSLPLALFVRPSRDEVQRRLIERGHGPPLPPDPWITRAREVRRVRGLLRRKVSPIVCLAGPSGIGKTALARALAKALDRHFADGIAWIDADRVQAPHLCSAQRTIAEALDFAGQLPDPGLVGRVQFDGAFRQLFWRRQRLLIVDHVTDAECALRFVPEVGGVAAIITTHTREVAERFADGLVNLGELSSKEARGLLSVWLGPARLERDPQGTDRLLALLGGHPRNLVLAARGLQRQRYSGIGDYAARIVAEYPQRASGTGEDCREAPADKTESIYPALCGQLRRLISAGGWRLFGQLGVCGDSPFSLEWAADIADEPLGRVTEVIAELVNHYLVREVDTFNASPTEQLFKLESQTMELARWLVRPEREQVLRRMSLNAPRRARRLIELTDPSLRSRLFAQCELWRLSLEYAMGQLLANRQPTESPLALVESAIEVRDTELALAFVEAVGTLRPVLEQRASPEGRRWLPSAFAVARAVGEDLAAAELALATAAHLAGGEPQPLRHRQWARAAAELSRSHCRWHDAALAQLWQAKSSAALGEIDAMVADLERALEDCRQPDGRVMPCVLGAIGLAHTRRGDWSRAERLIEQALQLAQHMPLVSAINACNLAVLRARGNNDGAEKQSRELIDAARVLAPLFPEHHPGRAHCLAIEAHAGVPGASSRARECWRECIRRSSSTTFAFLLFSIGEVAFFLSQSSSDTSHPLISADTVISDVGRGFDGSGFELYSLALLVPLEALSDVCDVGWFDNAEGFIRHAVGEKNPLYRELLQARSVVAVGEPPSREAPL